MAQLPSIPGVQKTSAVSPALRKRAACDRCHGQKLRCIKSPGAETCARCLKARSECIFSPANRPLRPEPRPSDPFPTPPQALDETSLPKNIEATTLNVFADTPQVSTDWYTQPMFNNNNYDLDMTDMQTSTSVSGSSLSSLPSWYSEPSTSASSISSASIEKEFNFQNFFDTNARPDLQLATVNPQAKAGHRLLNREGIITQLPKLLAPPTASMTGYVRQLSELSIKLVELHASIPSLSVHEGVGLDGPDCGDVGGFAMEHVYGYAQNLVEIYNPFIATLTELERARTAPQEVWSQSGCPSVKGTPPDLASVHLLLSCHHRLEDVLDLLMEHMRICISTGNLPVPVDNPLEECGSHIQIGGYKPSHNMRVIIEMAILCEFARQLYLLAGQLFSGLNSTFRFGVDTSTQSSPCGSSEPSPNSSESSYKGDGRVDATLSACRDMRNRAHQTHKALEELRTMLPTLF